MALTKYNYNSFDVTPAASKALAFNSDADGLTTMAGSSQVLIKTIEASSSSTISFVDGSSDVVLDNTYPVYVFKIINAHMSNDDRKLKFNLSVDTGSNYNVTKTTTAFRATNDEAGPGGQSDDEVVEYRTGADLAQSTSAQELSEPLGNENDESGSGELWLFNPSSTTFVKHFLAKFTHNSYEGKNMITYMSGYGNTTSAVDAVQFAPDSNTIETGTFKLYGIKDS